MASILGKAANLLERLTKPLSKPGKAALYILLSTPAALTFGLALGGMWLPLLQAAAFYPLYCRLLLGGQLRQALLASMGWALWMGLLAACLSYAWPEYCQHRILNAQAYQAEMFGWVRTGAGAEGDITLFLPQHLMHLGSFALLTLISAGFLGLVLGSALMNYMAFYVGTLQRHATDPLPVLLMAWPPWAILRVVAFILLATGLSAWLLNRLGLGQTGQRLKPFLVGGMALIGADILLKWLLAATWRGWLYAATHWP